MESRYIIPGALLQELLNYLSTRPYREVAPAIDALQKLDPVAKEPPASA